MDHSQIANRVLSPLLQNCSACLPFRPLPCVYIRWLVTKLLTLVTLVVFLVTFVQTGWLKIDRPEKESRNMKDHHQDQACQMAQQIAAGQQMAQQAAAQADQSAKQALTARRQVANQLTVRTSNKDRVEVKIMTLVDNNNTG